MVLKLLEAVESERWGLLGNPWVIETSSKDPFLFSLLLTMSEQFCSASNSDPNVISHHRSKSMDPVITDKSPKLWATTVSLYKLIIPGFHYGNRNPAHTPPTVHTPPMVGGCEFIHLAAAVRPPAHNSDSHEFKHRDSLYTLSSVSLSYSMTLKLPSVL